MKRPITKSPRDYNNMKVACEMLSKALAGALEICVPGASGRDVSDFFFRETKALGGKPSFLGYQGFPDSICVSVNDVVIHGIPNGNPFEKGDLIGLDSGINYRGMNSDAARSLVVGGDLTNKEASRLIKNTRDGFYAGLEALTKSRRTGSIGYAIDKLAKDNSLGNVKTFVGHGIGKGVHEPPEVPNYGHPDTGTLLKANLAIAIEPMFTLGSDDVYIDNDDWSVKTADGSLGAHWENTIFIHKDSVEVLTDKFC